MKLFLKISAGIGIAVLLAFFSLYLFGYINLLIFFYNFLTMPDYVVPACFP